MFKNKKAMKTCMAGTNVKNPIKMMKSSVQRYFVMYQPSLLRPVWTKFIKKKNTEKK
jgi:hypothetical protein